MQIFTRMLFNTQRVGLAAFVVMILVSCLLFGGIGANEALAAPGNTEQQSSGDNSTLSDASSLVSGALGAQLKTNTVNVVKSKKTPVLKISKKALSLECKSTAQLKVTGVAKSKVKWSSSNKKVAKVSKSGKVKAVSAGNAIVTATIGKKKTQCKVSVAPKLSANSIKLTYGETQTLNVAGASGGTVIWKSSNPKVAKLVSKDGLKVSVKAKSVGECIITAKTNGKVAKCMVSVAGQLSKTSVSLTPFDTVKLELFGGEVRSWETSDASIVRVNEDGVLSVGNDGVVGSATIICKDALGNHYECIARYEAPKIDFRNPYNMGVTYNYFTIFSLTNHSGRDIVFAHTDIIVALYDGDNVSYEVRKGLHSNMISDDYLSDKPLVVPDGEWVQFVAEAGYHFNDGWAGRHFDSKTFQLRITVDGNDYNCLISQDGAIQRFWPVFE